MLEYVEAIKPILIELDAVCPIDSPVGVDRDLLPLFKKHSPFPKIDIIPINSNIIHGFHIGVPDRGTATLFPRACDTHREIMEPACPECQHHRLATTKELVHVLDKPGYKTGPGDLADNIIDQLLKGAVNDNAQVHADGMAIFWAIELLVRFRHRIIITGTSTGGAHSALLSARRSDDYTYLGRQYGVPAIAAKMAFSERYMSTMRGIRQGAGLPVDLP